MILSNTVGAYDANNGGVALYSLQYFKCASEATLILDRTLFSVMKG